MDQASVGGMLRQLRQWLAPRIDHTAGDGQLLRQFIEQRDETAFARLMERHGPMVLGVCRDVLHQEQDVEDAFQATFLVLALRGAAVRKQPSVGSWLHGVAYRVALKARSRRATRQRRERALELEPAAPDPVEARYEQQVLVHDELQRLPQKYAAPLLLCCWQGKTQEEAAAQLGWTKGMVKGRLERGKDRLRFRLAQRGVTLTLPLVGLGLAAETIAAPVPTPLLRSVFGLLSAQQLPDSVQTLMEGMVPPMSLMPVKLTLVLSVVLIGLGLGWAGKAQPAPVHAPDLPWIDTTAQVEQDPAKDHNGDALPKGALVRIGTQRFRHRGPVTKLAYLPDGQSVVTTSGGEMTVRLWDVSTGKVRREMIPRQSAHECMTLTPDGKLLALGGQLYSTSDAPGEQRGGISLWNTDTGKLVREWVVPSGAVGDMAFSPDGGVLAAVTEKQVEFFHTQDGKPFAYSYRLQPGGYPLEARFAQLKRRYPNLTLPYRSRAAKAASCAFSPDGQLAIISLANGDVAMVSWSGENTSRVSTLRLSSGGGQAGFVLPLAQFAPDGRYFITAGRELGQLTLWETATGQRLRDWGSVEEPLWNVAFAPDGKTLTIVGTKAVQVYDLLTGKELHRWAGPAPTTLALSPDGRIAATARFNSIVFHDAATGQQIGQDQEQLGSITYVAFSPDGKRLATASTDHTVCLRDAAGGRPLLQLSDAAATMQHLSFSPDGKWLAATGYETDVWLWETATGKLIHHLSHRPEESGSNQPETRLERAFVTFAPDGSECIRVGFKPVSFLSWSTATGKIVYANLAAYIGDSLSPVKQPHPNDPKRGYRQQVESLALSPDCRRLAVGAGEFLVLFPQGFARTQIVLRSTVQAQSNFLRRSSDQEGGKPEELLLLKDQPPAIHLLAFSPNSKVLVSASAYSGEPLQLWDAGGYGGSGNARRCARTLGNRCSSGTPPRASSCVLSRTAVPLFLPSLLLQIAATWR